MIIKQRFVARTAATNPSPVNACCNALSKWQVDTCHAKLVSFAQSIIRNRGGPRALSPSFHHTLFGSPLTDGTFRRDRGKMSAHGHLPSSAAALRVWREFLRPAALRMLPQASPLGRSSESAAITNQSASGNRKNSCDSQFCVCAPRANRFPLAPDAKQNLSRNFQA